MADENETSIIQMNRQAEEAEESDEEEEEDESLDLDDDDLSIEEEFRGLYSDIGRIKERWLRMAKQKEEEKDSTSAQLLRLIAGDIIPIITDVIAASGGGFSEMLELVSDAASAEGATGLSEEDATQVYATLMSNTIAFQKLREEAKESEAKQALSHLIALNEDTMAVLRDEYGEELAEAAKDQLQQAAQVAATEASGR